MEQPPDDAQPDETNEYADDITTNPAYRLLGAIVNLFEAVSEAEELGSGTVEETWYAAGGARTIREARRTAREVQDFATDIIETLEATDVDEHLFIDPVYVVRDHLDQMPTWKSAARQWVGGFNEANMLPPLEYVIDKLNGVSPMNAIDRGTVGTLLDDLMAFRQHVERQDLDPRVREFLISHIDSMIDGVIRAKYLGPESLQPLVFMAVGEFATLPPEVQEELKGDKPSAKFWAFVTRINAFAALASKVKELGPGVIEIIGELPEAF